MSARARASTEADERLGAFVDMLAALAAGDFAARAPVLGDGSLHDGIATGLNMLAEELAEREAREAEIRARLVHTTQMSAVGELAGTIAHELNTPAAVLLANVAMMGDHGRAIGEALLGARRRLSEGSIEREALERALVEAGVEGAPSELSEMAQENADGVRRIATTLQQLVRAARDGSVDASV